MATTKAKHAKTKTARKKASASAIALAQNVPAKLGGIPQPLRGPIAAALAANAAYRTTAQLDGGTNNNPTLVEIISQDVPDQTGYSGRNYIDLDLTREDFNPEISVDRSGNPLSFATVSAALLNGSVAGAATANQGSAAPPSRTGAELRSILQGGPGLVQKPTALKIVSPDPAQIIQVPTALAKITVVCDAFPIYMDSTTVADVLKNPRNYISMTVGGKAVQNLTAEYGAADPSGGATAYFTFQGDISVAATANAVPYDINASGGIAQQPAATVTVTVQQSGAGGGGGPSPVPVLTILTPTDGAVIGALPPDGNTPQPYLVSFTGSATDAGGPAVTSVDIVINGDTSKQVTASPDPASGWSNWSADVLIPQYGVFQAAVTLTTNDPNTSISQRISAVLAPFGPRLWLNSRLMLVEEVRLTNFIGRAGPGRILRTMSLLPGETSTITVKTFLSESYSATDTSSIFDHVDTTTSDDFDTAIANEQTNKQEHSDSLNWGVEAKASASWGWGNASVAGKVDSGTKSANEDLTKNVSNATQKHAQSRSSKRDVQVNAESTTATTATNEQAIQRDIKNINVSRTLNFIFSQLNQEYLSILHLVGVRIGYVASFLDLTNGRKYDEYREASLPELGTLLQRVARNWQSVQSRIVSVLSTVLDYADVQTQVIEQLPGTGGDYWRFKHGLIQSWNDPTGSAAPAVEGLVLNGTKIVMRTEGVLVEAVLGQNPALDDYSAGLQTQALRQKTIANDAAQQLIDLVSAPNAAKTDAWQKTHPCCLPSTLSIAATTPPAAGSGGGAGGP